MRDNWSSRSSILLKMRLKQMMSKQIKGQSKVTLRCDKVSEDTVLIEIVDNGPGIGYSNNLFVPQRLFH